MRMGQWTDDLRRFRKALEAGDERCRQGWPWPGNRKYLKKILPVWVLLVNVRGEKGKIYVYESGNSGASWKDIGFSVPMETLPKLGYVDGLATNIELDPFSDDTIYVGTNGYGVYKTTNAGRTWFPMNQGLNTPFIKGPGALRVHPQLPGILFASTQAGGIYKSTNGASSWQRMTTGERFYLWNGHRSFNAIPGIVAGGGGNTLLISNDEGKSWQENHLPVAAHPQMAVYSVAFHPQRPGLVLGGKRFATTAGQPKGSLSAQAAQKRLDRFRWTVFRRST